VPWVEAMLRGQKVLARADGDGAFVDEAGRVEVRYKPNDGRAYRAAKTNLSRFVGGSVLPDAHCGPGEAPAEKSATVGAAKSVPTKKSAAAAKVVGPRAGEFTVYTDGACSGNPGPAGCGFLVIGLDGERREGFEFLGKATNNIAELTAILRGVEAVADLIAPVRVHTDSSYAIGVLQKGWRAKANVELIATIRIELARRPGVHLVYVPGHAGVPLNERADELAREAIQRRASRLLIAG
jgi:ribonuclease HI